MRSCRHIFMTHNHTRMTDTPNDQRFAGDIGAEYDMFLRASPHYAEGQDLVRSTIYRWARGRKHAGGNVSSWVRGAYADRIDAIEAGCGTGFTTRRILAADPRIHLTAIDSEPVMLAQARVVLGDEGGRLRLELGDLLTTLRAQPDESIDLFATAFTLHNCEPTYRADVMSEVGRVMRWDGLFIGFDKYARPTSTHHKADYAAQIAAFDVFDVCGRPDLREEWTRHYAEDDRIRFTLTEQRALFATNGFRGMKTMFRRWMDAVIVARRGIDR